MQWVRRVKPTPRGVGLALVGALLSLGGYLIGIRFITQVGLLLLGAVALGFLLLAFEARAAYQGGLYYVRRVTPHPVTVGQEAVVDVQLTSRGSARRLDRLDISEQAARELSGAAGLRARVRRSRTALELSYRINPEHRGRFPVGPLQVQRHDFFGVARWRGALGRPMRVAVRPRIVFLELDTRSVSTDVDRAATGTRMPAPDDALLRDYRIGDDLRRVHWRSTARRGELLVRQDERAARRPVSVVLDLPENDPVAEWSISAAASVCLALMRSGHRVRLLGGDVLGAVVDHHHPDIDGLAADALLDQTVDLTLPVNRGMRDTWLRTAIDTIGQQGGGAELVFAVVGGLDPDALSALARLGEVNVGWAMVREEGTTRTTLGGGETLEALHRAGWNVAAVTPGEDIAAAWSRLLGSDSRVEALR